jgi:adenine-specific DNA-methyltransferase
MNDVFGEDSFVGRFIWRKKYTLSYRDEHIIPIHEYVFCYKGKGQLKLRDPRWDDVETVSVQPIFKSVNKASTKIIRAGTTLRGKQDHTISQGVHKLPSQEIEFLDPAVFIAGALVSDVRVTAGFAVGQETLDSKQVEMSESGAAYVVDPSLEQYIKPISILFDYTKDDKEFIYSQYLARRKISTRQATAELDELIAGHVFDNPKPSSLVKYLCSVVEDTQEALILDFFAGSGTTAQAVLEMNEEDGGNRKFILVQLPEVVDEDSAAAKAGFANIAEITKERVRRVIKKLEGGTKDGLGLDGTKNLDRGFKVYALDRSNFVPWDATAATDAASLEKQLELSVDNVLHDRSHADLLAEILLKTGFPLNTPITKVTIAGTNVYQVADPGFLVCLADKVDAPLIKAIAATKPHRVVILDAAFQGNDALKTNAVQAFKDQGVEMFRTA